MPHARLPLLLVGLLLLAGSLSLSSCSKGGEQQAGPPPGGPSTPAGTTGSTSSGQTVTIAIVTNGISPFWDPMAVGMERAKAKYGCEASWSGPQSAEIPDQQRMI